MPRAQTRAATRPSVSDPLPPRPAMPVFTALVPLSGQARAPGEESPHRHGHLPHGGAP